MAGNLICTASRILVRMEVREVFCTTPGGMEWAAFVAAGESDMGPSSTTLVVLSYLG